MATHSRAGLASYAFFRPIGYKQWWVLVHTGSALSVLVPGCTAGSMEHFDRQIMAGTLCGALMMSAFAVGQHQSYKWYTDLQPPMPSTLKRARRCGVPFGSGGNPRSTNMLNGAITVLLIALLFAGLDLLLSASFLT